MYDNYKYIIIIIYKYFVVITILIPTVGADSSGQTRVTLRHEIVHGSATTNIEVRHAVMQYI